MQTSQVPSPWQPPQPLATPPQPAAPMPPPPRRHRRWPLWTAAGVGLAALGVGMLVMFDRTVLRHDLLTADFDTSAEPFVVGTMPEYVATLERGTYVLEATVDPDGWTTSFAMFTRPAYAVVLEAELVELDDPTADAALGIACYDLPETNGHGYVFMADPSGAHLFRLDPDAEEYAQTLGVDDTTPALALVGHRIGITCTMQGDAATVTATVDGVEIMSAVDAGGITRYQAGAMMFLPEHAGDRIRFDDVVARVPGE